MAKIRIGRGDRLHQFRIAETVADKGFHHAKGDLLVGLTRQRRNIGAAHLRNGLRHIQPTVPRQSTQHGLFK